MTNKEAIQELEIMLKSCNYDEQFEALDLAIKALEATQKQFDLLCSLAEALGGTTEEQ